MTLSQKIERLLEPEEWDRIKDRVWLLERDREIRRNYRALTSARAIEPRTKEEAFEYLGGRYCLSPDTISGIVHPRTR